MAAGNALKSRKVVVVGVDAASIAITKFLVKKGAIAKLVDLRASAIIEPLVADVLDPTKYTLECGDFGPQTFAEAQLVVAAPSFPIESKLLDVARAAGIETVTELEFFAQNVAEPIVLVSGTAGKSTTAALIASLLENSGKTVFTNVSQPLSLYLNQSKAVDAIVAVADTFQTDGIKSLKAKALVVTNFSEDQLHRYPTIESQFAAQREVVRAADENTVIVLNAQDPQVVALAPHLAGQTRFFSSQEVPEGIEAAWYNKSALFVRSKEDAEVWNIPLTQLRIRGSHNKENLAAAILAALPFGATRAALEKVVATFSALPGRVEFVRRMNSVAFYSDAAGTTVQAVIRTLQAFQEPVILISGGRDKNQDFSPLIPHIRQRVKNLILVGEAKEKMNRAIGDYTETFLVGTLEEAIILAYQKSRSGDIVLFSPGVDPGDQFASDFDKSDYYKKLVSQIAAPRRPNVSKDAFLAAAALTGRAPLPYNGGRGPARERIVA